jgi:hypothetical protein
MQCFKRNYLKSFARLAVLVLTSAAQAGAQELFVYTEPASNMPANSLGLRASNWMMRERPDEGGGVNYHLIPELMWGVNKAWMMHAEAFFSNRDGRLTTEGGALYAKYRFLSQDGDHRHFRMAAYGRAATNNSSVHQEEIETNGHNSGLEGGLIATQLLHKTALSSSASFENAMDGNKAEEYSRNLATHAMNYTFSAGQLILPKKYTSYKQTNLNLMMEVLGQWLPENGRSFLDVAPSVQLIFNSQTRLDVGYRRQLYSTMERTAPNGIMVRVEHTLFNVL